MSKVNTTVSMHQNGGLGIISPFTSSVGSLGSAFLNNWTIWSQIRIGLKKQETSVESEDGFTEEVATRVDGT